LARKEGPGCGLRLVGRQLYRAVNRVQNAPSPESYCDMRWRRRPGCAAPSTAPDLRWGTLNG